MDIFKKKYGLFFLILISSLWFFFFFANLNFPLIGAQKWRQAASLFPGYFYCVDNDPFLLPKISFRGKTPGISIGEFPVFSYSVATVCKITGGWSEALTKLVSLFFFFSMIFVWWKFQKLRYSLTDNSSLWLWIVCIVGIPVNLTYLSIPFPEAAALLFIGIGGWLWEFVKVKGPKGSNSQKLLTILAVLSFLLGFLIRPYYISFLFFFWPGLITVGLTGLASVGLFYLWYRYWDRKVTTNIYYGIGLESFREVLANIPSALAVLPKRFVDHTAWVGLYFFGLTFRNNPRLIYFYLANIFMMLGLKSGYLFDHPYYLLNAGIAASLISFDAFLKMSVNQRNLFASLLLLSTTASTQHNWRAPNNEQAILKLVEQGKSLPKDALVASFLGPDERWLYYLKAKGWVLPPTDFKGPQSCPEGAQYYLIEPTPGNYELGACGKP